MLSHTFRRFAGRRRRRQGEAFKVITPLSQTTAEERGERGGEARCDGICGGNPRIQQNQTFALHPHFPSFLLPHLSSSRTDNGLNIQYISQCQLSFHTSQKNPIFNIICRSPRHFLQAELLLRLKYSHWLVEGPMGGAVESFSCCVWEELRLRSNALTANCSHCH